MAQLLALPQRAVERLRALPLWPKRRRRFPIIRPYIDSRAGARRITKILFPIVLAFVLFVYGFFFALTAPYLIIPFSIPILLLVLLGIWALPDTPHAPIKILEFCFSSLFISLIIWPNYLAISLPGMPWITVLRLASFPMAFLLLICLSTSAKFRSTVSKSIRSISGLGTCLTLFFIIQFATLPLSNSIGDSIQRTILSLIYVLGIYLVSLYLFSKKGRSERYIALIVLMSIPIMLVTIAESRVEQVLWNGHVPSFLKVSDPIAAHILSSTTRGATGQYRAKATFSTPLGLAEYLSLLTPFLLNYAIMKYNAIIRMISGLAVIALFYCIILTDARLGIIGFLVSIILYFLFWALHRFKRDDRDLFAAAITYGYPAIAAAALAASIFVHRIHSMVFGDGSQESSNLARQDQMALGIPKFLQNPFGHGTGTAATVLGYSPDGFVTIDNYYLNLALDWGIVGISMFFAIFLMSISAALRGTLRAAKSNEREIKLLIPLAVSLSGFLVVKSVFSQDDNHPIFYMMLGMIGALVSRIKTEEAVSKEVEPAEASAVQTPLRTPLRGSPIGNDLRRQGAPRPDHPPEGPRRRPLPSME